MGIPTVHWVQPGSGNPGALRLIAKATFTSLISSTTLLEKLVIQVSANIGGNLIYVSQ